jgi:hypothetical protein
LAKARELYQTGMYNIQVFIIPTILPIKSFFRKDCPVVGLGLVIFVPFVGEVIQSLHMKATV